MGKYGYFLISDVGFSISDFRFLHLDSFLPMGKYGCFTFYPYVIARSDLAKAWKRRGNH